MNPLEQALQKINSALLNANGELDVISNDINMADERLNEAKLRNYTFEWEIGREDTASGIVISRFRWDKKGYKHNARGRIFLQEYNCNDEILTSKPFGETKAFTRVKYRKYLEPFIEAFAESISNNRIETEHCDCEGCLGE